MYRMIFLVKNSITYRVVLLYTLYMERYNHGDMYTLNLITLDIFEEGSKIHHTDKETKNRKMKKWKRNCKYK